MGFDFVSQMRGPTIDTSLPLKAMETGADLANKIKTPLEAAVTGLAQGVTTGLDWATKIEALETADIEQEKGRIGNQKSQLELDQYPEQLALDREKDRAWIDNTRATTRHTELTSDAQAIRNEQYPEELAIDREYKQALSEHSRASAALTRTNAAFAAATQVEKIKATNAEMQAKTAEMQNKLGLQQLESEIQQTLNSDDPTKLNELISKEKYARVYAANPKLFEKIGEQILTHPGFSEERKTTVRNALVKKGIVTQEQKAQQKAKEEYDKLLGEIGKSTAVSEAHNTLGMSKEDFVNKVKLVYPGQYLSDNGRVLRDSEGKLVPNPKWEGWVPGTTDQENSEYTSKNMTMIMNGRIVGSVPYGVAEAISQTKDRLHTISGERMRIRLREVDRETAKSRRSQQQAPKAPVAPTAPKTTEIKVGVPDLKAPERVQELSLVDPSTNTVARVSELDGAHTLLRGALALPPKKYDSAFKAVASNYLDLVQAKAEDTGAFADNTELINNQLEMHEDAMIRSAIEDRWERIHTDADDASKKEANLYDIEHVQALQRVYKQYQEYVSTLKWGMPGPADEARREMAKMEQVYGQLITRPVKDAKDMFVLHQRPRYEKVVKNMTEKLSAQLRASSTASVQSAAAEDKRTARLEQGTGS